MGTTVGNKDIATKGSGHTTVTPPAVSLNPPPPAPTPGPYPYSARSATAKDTKKTLKAGGSPVVVKGSVLNVDPPANQPSQPTGGDIVTHGVKGKASTTQGSSNTKASGKPVCGTGDMTRCNLITGKQAVAQQTMPLLKAGGADAAGGKDGGGADKDKKGKRALPAQGAKKCTKAGHPVDVARGVVVDSAVEFALPGAIPVELERHYSSARARETTALGRGGWVHSFEQWIVEGEDCWTLRDADGLDLHFAKVEPTESAFHRGERLTLTVQGPGSFSVFDHATGLSRQFRRNEDSDRARLAEIRDSYGNQVRLDYRGDLLERIVDTAGRELRLQHTPNGHVARIEVWASAPLPPPDPDATPAEPKPLTLEQWADFTYHESGELASAADALGHADRFEYDGYHCMVKTTLKNGVSFHYAYDDDTGFCIKTWGDGGLHEVDLFPDLESKTTLVSGTNEPRLYTWNDDGLVVCEQTHDGQICRTKEYDADQYLLRETNGAEECTEYEYDERGNLIKITDPAGRETRWAFSEDRPTRRIGPDGLETRYEHDSRGALVATTYPSGRSSSLGYDEQGQLVEVRGDDGVLAALRYDSSQNLAEQVDARGAKTRYTYDPLGRPLARIDALGRRTEVCYDALRQLLELRYPDGTVSKAEYEPLGNVARFTDALGQTRELDYGGTGTLTRLRQADGSEWRFRYDSDERLREIENPSRERYRYDYDRDGRVTEERTFDGRRLDYRYDNAERLARVEYGDETWREFIYDRVGSVVEDRSPHGAIHYERDDLGRLSRTLVEDPWGDVENTFERDHLGRVVAETQGGRTVRYRYDGLGRRAERVLPDGQSTRYEYDELGVLAAIEHDGRRLAIERDQLGRVTRKHHEPSGVCIDSGHDEMDRLVDQRVSTPSSDGAGARTLLTERRWSYDALGRPNRIHDGRWGSTEYGYSHIGQLVQARSARQNEVFEYDPTGSLVAVLDDLATVGESPVWETAPGNVLTSADRARFENDERGRRTAKVEVVPAADGGRPEARTEYDWDCRDRLREVRLPDGRKVRFSYDAFARRTKKEIIGADGGDFAGLVHRALDERPESLAPSRVVEFVWDGDALCADIGAAVPPSGAEHAGAEPEQHLSAAAQIARDHQGDPAGAALAGDDADHWAARGRQVRAFAHEPGGLEPLLQAAHGQVFAYVNDHLGTPKELIDDDGRIAWAAVHSAWGEVQEETRDPDAHPAESPFRLLGQYADEETDLCYTRYRYFDSRHGRWCSPDPLGIDGGINAFAFDGTPTADVDPLGLACNTPGFSKIRIILALLMRFNWTSWKTAFNIATGRLKLNQLPTDPHGGAGVMGRNPWGSNEAQIYLDQVKNVNQAAGVAAHEGTHAGQGIAPSTYRRTHEVEAFRAQRDADPTFPLRTDAQINNHVNSHPGYQHVPP